jgi:hypothetical protein
MASRDLSSARRSRYPDAPFDFSIQLQSLSSSLQSALVMPFLIAREIENVTQDHAEIAPARDSTFDSIQDYSSPFPLPFRLVRSP